MIDFKLNFGILSVHSAVKCYIEFESRFRRLEILNHRKKKEEESNLSRSGVYNLCEILQIAPYQSD